ncbi:uncharacterized protein LOC111045931 [Nilaparvata lugens]|uniref:uncharacterized protein LOC111045931 n=1 Tax=Nilaparvata lugens TaxID=108931 RepID=UPI00193E6275|nr:uncharacterized protein LOC111045931 [Nilaparvata lugens]
MASTAAGDKTVNKVALCSAIFAGFAYVGYSVVRTAFCRKLARKDGEGYPEEHHIFFRRLSQTTQTDVLLGDLDLSGSGKVVLRPLTVQERIRELNLRARMFTDTMLAIQGSAGPSPKHSPLPGPASLQCSPWGSPRILSPVDVRHILASRSSENLTLLGSPVKRRYNRRSLRRQRSPHMILQDCSKNEDSELEAQKLFKDTQGDLKKNLESLSLRERVMNLQEAKSLVALLHCKDNQLLERTLNTIANLSTFAANQDMMREAGCLYRLQKLLSSSSVSVQNAAIRALGNLALNEGNQKEMKDIIPVLLSFILHRHKCVDAQVNYVLFTLTNIAVLSAWHEEFYSVLHNLFRMIDDEKPQLKLQALKLLINLACNEDMVPSLLAAQAPRRLIYMLDPLSNEDILLRIVTLVQIEKYAAVFGVNVQEKIQRKSFVLMNQHPNEDIRIQARKIYEAVKS